MIFMVSKIAYNNLTLLIAVSLLGIASAGCSKEADTKETRLSRASNYFSADQFDKAEKEYREILTSTPSDPVALSKLGIIYYEQGQLPQAFPLLKQATERMPDNVDVRIKFGLTLFALRQFPEARDAALQVLEKEQGNEQALLLLADTAFPPISSADETRALIERLRAQDRDRPGYHLALGSLDMRQKEEARGEGEFKAALAMDPKSGAAHSALGVLYWSRNDLKAAAQEFKTAAELAPARSSMRLRYADFLQRTGASDEAKAVLEEINRKVPDYLPPRVYLMRIACAKQRDEDCTKRVQDILAQDPINFDALFQDGSLNLAKGETGKAIREFEQLSGIYSQNAQVRYQLALGYLQFAKSAGSDNSRKALENAESNLTTAVKLDPRLEQAAILLAEIKIRKGSPAAAIDLLLPLVKDRPQLAQAHYLLGSAYLAQQNAAQALAVYRQMAELFPQDPQPHFLIGTILLAQRQLPEARSAFEKAISLDPNHLPAIERLVDLDLAEQKIAAAMERIQKQIDRDPKLPLPLAIRGKIYLAQRDFPHAEADLLKAIEIDPKLEPAYTLLSQLYLATNKPELAIEKLKGFVEKNQSVSALMTLAGIQERVKNFTAAQETYEKALALSPNLAPALNNLAVLYSERLGQPEKAYELAKKARDANPNEPHAADTLGWIVFKRGEYPQALRLLQDSAAKLPTSAEIQFHLGSAHYMLGEENLALAALKKATDGGADFPGKDEARQRIDVLSIDPAAATPANRSALQSFLTQRPNDPMGLFKLAEIQKRDGALDDAIKTYEKLLAADAFFTPATQRLAVLYSQHATDEPKALEVTQKAYQAYPEDAEVVKALGILSFRREYYPRAGELLKQAAAKRNDDAELLYYLGAVQHQLKQWADCKLTLERAVTLNLPTALAGRAKGLLAECAESAPP